MDQFDHMIVYTLSHRQKEEKINDNLLQTNNDLIDKNKNTHTHTQTHLHREVKSKRMQKITLKTQICTQSNGNKNLTSFI